MLAVVFAASACFTFANKKKVDLLKQKRYNERKTSAACTTCAPLALCKRLE
ncbi:MAG: hypothetical protein HC893_07795 [Chloroflexaceae bacterium]|nr:hypothetical protein [Chloroflexaceae bacterium]